METGRNLAWFFIDHHPENAARLLENLQPSEVAALLGEAPVRLAARLLLKMAPAPGAACLAELDPSRSAEILEELPAPVAAGLLRSLAVEVREHLVENLSPEAARPLGILLRYDGDTAGALMDPGALALPLDSTVGHGRDLVRRHARQALYYIYVVDEERRLTGVVTMRQLLLAAAGDPIATIMRPDLASLNPGDDRMAILSHPGWRMVHALPVVDPGGALLGVVRYETLRRLEDDAAAVQRARGLQRAALELGEIYWLSIGRLIASLGGMPGDVPPSEHPAGAVHGS